LTPSLAGVRYDETARHGHVESYFLKANDPAGDRALWVRATFYAPIPVPGEPRCAVAETWAVAFDRTHGHVAAKSGLAYERAEFSASDLGITIDGASYSRTAWRGQVATGDRKVGWDLSIVSIAPALHHLPQAWMYGAQVPGAKLLSITPDARVTGKVTVGDAVWSVERWPAMIGHNWGARQTSRYAWGHCNAWEGTGTELVFEGVAVRRRVGLLDGTATALFVRHRGERFDWNGALDLTTNHSSTTLRRWTFGGKNRRASIEGELWAATDDFVGLYYPDPGGKRVTCLSSNLAHAEIRFCRRGEAPMDLRSRSAALEIGTRETNHGVRMYL